MVEILSSLISPASRDDGNSVSHDEWTPPAAANDPRIDRIVVINDFSVPEGGAGILALLAIRQYRQRGYAVTFITGQQSTAELAALGVEVIGLGSKALLHVPAWRALSQGFHNADARRMVGDWIDRHDTPATVYHLHNWSQILSPAVFEALSSVDRRTVVTCHDFFNVCPNGGFLHYGKAKPCELTPLSLQCAASQCDRRNAFHKYWRLARHVNLNRLAGFAKRHWTFSFIHDSMRQKFAASGFEGSDLVTVVNPVRAWTEERIRAEDNVGFLFVGRLGSDKGADIALDAARLAGQAITMVGTGELETQAAANPHARFVGWCDAAGIAEHARHARALIVPSRTVEPFGLVILEAAMSGIPVLVTDRAYLAPDVESHGFGRRFSVSDVPGIADLMTALADDDRLVQQMSMAGFERASRLCHTPQSWIADFLEIFGRKLRELA